MRPTDCDIMSDCDELLQYYKDIPERCVECTNLVKFFIMVLVWVRDGMPECENQECGQA